MARIAGGDCSLAQRLALARSRLLPFGAMRGRLWSRGKDVVAVDRLGPREGPVLKRQQTDDPGGTECTGTIVQTASSPA